MERLSIAATEDTPEVYFDASAGVLRIVGRALPEDAHEFFRPLQDWVDAYVQSPAPATVVELRIDYFNSAATRYIFNILMVLEELAGIGADIRVRWHFRKDDEMIAAKGEELQSMLEIPFEMHPQ